MFLLLIQGPFCGVTSPMQVVVPGGSASVGFRSDDSESYKGFQLIWQAECNNIPLL